MFTSACAPSFSRRKAAIERCRVLVCVAGVVHTGALCDSSADFPAIDCSRTRCTVPAVTARRALVRLSPTFRLTTPSASPRGAPFLPAMAGILATVPLWLRVLGAAELQRCHGCAVRVAGATARGCNFVCKLRCVQRSRGVDRVSCVLAGNTGSVLSGGHQARQQCGGERNRHTVEGGSVNMKSRPTHVNNGWRDRK